MAEDLAQQQPVALPAPSAPLIEPRRIPEEHRVYRRRFAFMYLALAVIAGGALGGAIVAYDRAPEDAGVAWSDWRPEGNSFSYPRQIATYVGRKYKLPSGNPLVGVVASRAEVPTGDGSTVLPIRGAAIFNNPQGDQRDFTSVETEDSVMYNLCGFNPGCAIKEGKPSPERLLLLRREAVELALYSFKYMDGLDTVIAFLPTNPGRDAQSTEDDQNYTLFFQKRDFEQELDHPLVRTLPKEAPALGKIPDAEELTIERLTASRIFGYQFTPTQTGTLVMLLVPAQ
jgi:hypothetical protein